MWKEEGMHKKEKESLFYTFFACFAISTPKTQNKLESIKVACTLLIFITSLFRIYSYPSEYFIPRS